MKFKNSAVLKTLALMLALMLCFSGVTAGAKETESTTDSRAIKLLEALDIMHGDEYTGMFWDDTPVKRSEMAKIICRIFKLEEKAQDTPMFKDVRDSDRACVETAVVNGYMNGHGDGTFGADDYITANQIIKTFVCIINAGSIAEQLGGYPMGYLNIGKRLGIVSNMSSAGEDYVKRIDVANIIYNTLHADILQLSEISSDGVGVFDVTKGETFLTETLNIYTDSGIITENGVTGLNQPGGVGDNKIKVGKNTYSDPQGFADDCLGYSVTVYYSKPDEAMGEIIYVEEGYDNKVITMDSEDVISADNSKITYYENEKEKTVNISATADMIYNGSAVEFDENLLTDLINNKNGSIKVINNNNDGEYDIVYITKYETEIIDKIRISDERISLKYGGTLIDLKDMTYRIFKNGVKATLEDLQSGDVILVAKSKTTGSDGYVLINAADTSAMGKVEVMRTDSAEGKEYVKISGTEYEISLYCKELQASGKIPSLKIGDSGNFYTDANGKITAYSVNETNSGVGYLIKSGMENGIFSAEISVKMYTETGEIQVFTADEKIKVDDVKKDVSDIVANSTLKDKFNTAQLVKYSAEDGVLKEIDFAEDQYSANDFSKAAEGTFNCSTATVLDDKYCVSNDTKVFVVPNPITDDKGYFGIYNGSYFVRDVNYTGVLYDLSSTNMVSYAVIKIGINDSNLKYNSPLLLVDSVLDTMNAEGDRVKAVEGWDENGKKVTYNFADGKESYASEIQKSDVIHYRLNFANEICEMSVKKNSATKYNLSVLASTTKTVYGEVGALDTERIMVATTAVSDSMTPMDMAKSVSKGTAMYKYNSETGNIRTIDFGEIEKGDKIFACIEGSNKTRILVIYE